MNLDYYRRDINGFIGKYNKIRLLSGVYVVVFVLLFLLWLVSLGMFLIIRTDIYKIVFIGLSIVTGLYGFIVLILLSMSFSKKHRFMKNDGFKLIKKILAAECDCWLQPVAGKVKDVIVKTELCSRYDAVRDYISFRFNINDVSGTYIMQQTTRQGGNASVDILWGDVMIFSDSVDTTFQIRNKREYFLSKYRYKADFSDYSNFVYFHKTKPAPKNCRSEKDLFRKLVKLYPEKLKCGIAFHPDTLAFFANNKIKYKTVRKLNFDKFQNYLNLYLDALKRIEKVIAVISRHKNYNE